MTVASQRVPVSILTGFLGSGKTTLLAHLLRQPALARTAVVMNEFGEVGLDHDLIETSDESFVQLSTGCLCCRVRSDLVLTLSDLAARRQAGTLPPFERVVIETSGLAEPGPILHALLTDAALVEVYALDGIVTTVDALLGAKTLAHYEQSLHQAAVADRIVLTKTDLGTEEVAPLLERLARINPGAQVLRATRGAIDPVVLFGRGTEAAGHEVAGALDRLIARIAGTAHVHTHDEELTAVCVVRERPLHAVTLSLLLSALAENCGADLLRLKGIVGIVEQPEQPAVVHGVQHVYHAPIWLDRWPSADRRTRLVLIGRRIQESWVRDLIDLLDHEVCDELARRLR